MNKGRLRVRMLDANVVSRKMLNIMVFYELGKLALKDKRIIAKYIKEQRMIDIALVKSAERMADADKFMSKELREYLLSDSATEHTRKMTKESARFSLNAIRTQTVVMLHSYIEIIMGEIVSMVLEKDENMLKVVYYDKGNLPFNISDLLDNKGSIIKMLAEKECNRFLFLSMEKKAQYFKKYLNMDILNWTDFPHFSTDLMKIDKLRHDIIHSNKDVQVSDSELISVAWYLGHFSNYLLKTAKEKHAINIIPIKPLNIATAGKK